MIPCIWAIPAVRRRCAAKITVGRLVQLRAIGGADSGGSSVARDPDARGRGAAATCREFRGALRADGRPSIPPERLLRALLLQAFYTVRSERQLMEQLDYNLLFRWFVGLSARRSGVGCDGVLQEPGPAARRRYRAQVHGRGAEPAAGAHAAVERALLGRRHADRGLGQHEELSRRRTARRSARPGRNGERDFHGNPKRHRPV